MIDIGDGVRKELTITHTSWWEQNSFEHIAFDHTTFLVLIQIRDLIILIQSSMFNRSYLTIHILYSLCFIYVFSGLQGTTL